MMYKCVVERHINYLLREIKSKTRRCMGYLRWTIVYLRNHQSTFPQFQRFCTQIIIRMHLLRF